jgi:hypothetical protein
VRRVFVRVAVIIEFHSLPGLKKYKYDVVGTLRLEVLSFSILHKPSSFNTSIHLLQQHALLTNIARWLTQLTHP